MRRQTVSRAASSIRSAAVIVFSSCINIGPAPFAPAEQASGAIVAMRVPGEKADRLGELLAVDSIGAILRVTSGQRPSVQRIHWSLGGAMDVAQLGADYDRRPREAMDRAKLARLSLVCRFPQGLTGELLAKVLAELNQAALEEVSVAGSSHSSGEPRALLSLDSLAAKSTRATERFADRTTAIRAGYRRIGTDFPGMGEHWLNPTVFLSGTIDPERPTILAYALIDGRPVLNGVGFIVTTRGDSSVADVPGWPDAWHEHSGLLDEESRVKPAVSQTRLMPLVGSAEATHVWVLHIWTRLPNPAGRYAADNWALPFVRLGLIPPREVSADAALALSLLAGGDDYLRGSLSDAGLVADLSRANSLIDRARRRARQLIESSPEGEPLSSALLHELATAWRSLADGAAKEFGEDARQLFASTHDAHTAHGGH